MPTDASETPTVASGNRGFATRDPTERRTVRPRKENQWILALPLAIERTYVACQRGNFMQRRKGIVIAPLLVAGLVMLMQYFHSEKVVNPETGRASRVAMSTQQEEALGFQSYQEVLSQSRGIETAQRQSTGVQLDQGLL